MKHFLFVSWWCWTSNGHSVGIPFSCSAFWLFTWLQESYGIHWQGIGSYPNSNWSLYGQSKNLQGKFNFKQQIPMLLFYLSFIVLNEIENFEASKCILFVLKKHFTGSENPSKLSFILLYIILFRYFMSIIVTVVLLIVCFYSDV